MKFFLLALFLMGMSGPVYGGEGSGATNGVVPSNPFNRGQQIPLEFTQAALRGLTALVQHKDRLPKDLKEIDTDALAQTIKSARLLSKPSLCSVDHQTGEELCFDALNFPSRNEIEVSEARWEANRKNPKFQVTIAVHEYLGLMGKEINQYYLSAQLDPWLSSDPISDRLSSLRMGVYLRKANGSSLVLKVSNIDLLAKTVLVSFGYKYDKNDEFFDDMLFKCPTVLAQKCDSGMLRGEYRNYLSVIAPDLILVELMKDGKLDQSSLYQLRE